ncbi:MAG: PAS domain-containing protein, partial [Planctomycetales bacterium]|nr:PAS domain-containing protein [Planctomycetales bacterium]
MSATRPADSSSEMITELLPKILQTIPYMVFWKDRQSQYLGCNDVFASCAGLANPEDIIGLSDFDLPWTREEAEGYRADDREVMASGLTKLHIIESQLNAEGERTWLDTSKVPLRNSDGDVIGVLGIYANITEQRVAQEQLRTTRQYLQDAIESIDAGLVMYDANERFVFCNNRYKELYECPDELFVPGKSYQEILTEWMNLTPQIVRNLTSEDQRQAWIEERLLAHRKAHTGAFEQRLDDRVILISDRPTRDGGVVSLRTDITHLKEIESDLREAKEAAEAASHAKTGFLANMSHEIRTPMAAILGFTDVLLEGQCSAEQNTMLQTIKRNGEHLLALINDILDLSKIEAGKFAISSDSVEIATICHEVIDTLSWKAREKGIALEFTIASEFPKAVLGDSLRIRQVIMNLVGNAIKFTEQGAVTLALSTCHNRGFGELLIEVRDTGIGLSLDECQSVFQPFQQADASTTRRFGGTGLGLTISRRLVELQGGTLELESEVGKGSLFTCRLPLNE